MRCKWDKFWTWHRHIELKPDQTSDLSRVSRKLRLNVIFNDNVKTIELKMNMMMNEDYVKCSCSAPPSLQELWPNFWHIPGTHNTLVLGHRTLVIQENRIMGMADWLKILCTTNSANQSITMITFYKIYHRIQVHHDPGNNWFRGLANLLNLTCLCAY